MQPRLKIAVIGAGRLGGFHAQKLAALPDVELTAIVDPLAANGQRVAAAWHTQALTDHRPLLGHVDAVVVASPTAWHHRLGLEFLEAGVHVLVEKPMCSTVAEAEELVDAARRRGLILQVGHVERFNPAFAAAAAAAPHPKYIESVRAGNFTFRSMDVGVVLDLMIHDLDLVLAWVGSPVRQVEALGMAVMGDHEDVANARLQFASGCVATLSASRVSYEPTRRMHAWSPQAFAAVDFAARTCTVVRPSETLRRHEFHAASMTAEQVEYYKTHLVEEHLPRRQQSFEAVDALALQMQDFVDAIRNERSPRVNGLAGRDALAVAQQIVASIATHAWNGTSAGPLGPQAQFQPRVVPAPHFSLSPLAAPTFQPEIG